MLVADKRSSVSNELCLRSYPDFPRVSVESVHCHLPMPNDRRRERYPSNGPANLVVVTVRFASDSASLELVLQQAVFISRHRPFPDLSSHLPEAWAAAVAPADRELCLVRAAVPLSEYMLTFRQNLVLSP